MRGFDEIRQNQYLSIIKILLSDTATYRVTISTEPQYLPFAVPLNKILISGG